MTIFAEAPTLYNPVSKENKIHILVKMDRLLAAAPLTLKGQTKMVPFLLDTGSPRSFIHMETLRRFGVTESVPEEVRATIGIHMEPTFKINTCTTATADGSVPHHVGFLNIIGIDIINLVCPELPAILSDAFARKQKPDPIDPVWVRSRDGGPAFKVTPVANDVASLKDAIKAKKAPRLDHIASDELTLYTIDADGSISTKACDPEHTLLPGTKYAFAQPELEGQRVLEGPARKRARVAVRKTA